MSNCNSSRKSRRRRKKKKKPEQEKGKRKLPLRWGSRRRETRTRTTPWNVWPPAAGESCCWWLLAAAVSLVYCFNATPLLLTPHDSLFNANSFSIYVITSVLFNSKFDLCSTKIIYFFLVFQAFDGLVLAIITALPPSVNFYLFFTTTWLVGDLDFERSKLSFS